MAERDMNIYVVHATDADYLVEAKTKAAALGFIVQNTHQVEMATQKQLVDMVQSGIKVQSASQLPLPPTE